MPSVHFFSSAKDVWTYISTFKNQLKVPPATAYVLNLFIESKKNASATACTLNSCLDLKCTTTSLGAIRISISKTFKKLNLLLKSLKQPKISEELVSFLNSPFPLPSESSINDSSVSPPTSTSTIREDASDCNISQPKAQLQETRNSCEKCSKLKADYANHVASLKAKLRQSKNDCRRICLNYDVKRVNQQVKRYTEQIRKLREKVSKLKHDKRLLSARLVTKSPRQVTTVRKENLSLKRKLFLANEKVHHSDLKVKKLNEEVRNLEVEAVMQEEDEVSDEKARIICDAMRKCIYFCLMSHVPVEATGQVIKYIAECQGKDVLYVPHPATVSRCSYELGILCDIQCAEFLLNAESLTLAWDATTLKGAHINQVVVSSKEKFMTLATDLLPGGTSEDYADHLVHTISNIVNMYAKFLNLDALGCMNSIVQKFRCTMSDRASVNHCTVVRLMAKLDVSLLELNCQLHPLEAFASAARDALLQDEKSSSNRSQTFGQTAGAVNVIAAISKLRFKDGKGDPTGIKAFLKSQKIDASLLPRYVGNRLHIVFHLGGSIFYLKDQLLTYLKTQCSQQKLRLALIGDLSNNFIITHLQVLGLFGKVFTGPWMAEIYSSASDRDHMEKTMKVLSCLDFLGRVRDNPELLLTTEEDGFGNPLSCDNVPTALKNWDNSSSILEAITLVASKVERLCERVSSSTLLDDRRDAVRALKALSKILKTKVLPVRSSSDDGISFDKYRVEVGTQAMDILLNVLEQDRNDTEIISYALDTFHNIMSNEPTDEDDVSPANGDLGCQFTEIYIKRPENVSLLLTFLEEYDFHVRWPTVKLLTVLLTNKQKELQEIILVVPMGVSRLMDLLSDSREIVRNDALLLLNQLTKGHGNIQKIVAFENAFERIIDIVREEGATDGGIVVEDCLLLLQNLLRNNTSNQNFFKEGSFIQRLKPFFQLDDESPSRQGGWSAQKVTNMHLLLQLVRTLVSPNNPQNQTVACQKVMNSCGLLQDLCSILMATGVPADVLTETINTVSEVIRGSQPNQEYFASVLAPSNPPRPAIVVLLMSMVNEKQPFVLRCAVLYCFQSFLYKNEVGQSQIIQTLLPTAADANSITAGQLLCGGLFNADPLSNWFSAVALLHAIVENPTQKEQLLRVQLATSLGNPPVSLLQQCCNMLSQGGKVQTKIALLMILCGWMADCPIAVSHFLSNTANVPYLISQVSSSEADEHEVIVQGLCAFLLGICMLYNNDATEAFTKSALKQVIQNRIGLESFTDKLMQVAQNENYTRAAKKPHLYHKHPNEIVFDYEFTRLFKMLENEVLKAVSGTGSVNGRLPGGPGTDHYKALLKEQEDQVLTLRKNLEEMQAFSSSSEKIVVELKSQVQQLKDQNALLKAQKANQGTPPPGTTNSSSTEEVETLRKELDNMRLQLQDKDARLLSIASGGDKSGDSNPATEAALQASLSQLQGEVAHKDSEIVSLRAEVDRLGHSLQQGTHGLENASDQGSRLHEVESQVATLTAEKNSLNERLKKANEENLKLTNNIRVMEEEKTATGGEYQELKEEMETLKKEQDDLLVLLADQDAKIEKYKTKLKDLGQEVEDDDDDDDEDLGQDDEDAD